MAYVHIRQSKLEARALRCVMVGYQKGVKGYRLWCIEPNNQKIIISRDVQFEETRMPYLEGKSGQEVSEVEKMVQVEVEDIPAEEEVASEDAATNAEVVTEVMEPSRSENNLDGYMLARDRARRNPRPSTRYSEEEYLLYVLCIAENIEYVEPVSFKEAMASKESK